MASLYGIKRDLVNCSSSIGVVVSSGDISIFNIYFPCQTDVYAQIFALENSISLNMKKTEYPLWEGATHRARISETYNCAEIGYRHKRFTSGDEFISELKRLAVLSSDGVFGSNSTEFIKELHPQDQASARLHPALKHAYDPREKERIGYEIEDQKSFIRKEIKAWKINKHLSEVLREKGFDVPLHSGTHHCFSVKIPGSIEMYLSLSNPPQDVEYFDDDVRWVSLALKNKKGELSFCDRVDYDIGSFPCSLDKIVEKINSLVKLNKEGAIKFHFSSASRIH